MIRLVSIAALCSVPLLLLAIPQKPKSQDWVYKPDHHCAVVIPSRTWDRVPTPMLVPCIKWEPETERCTMNIPAGWLVSSEGQFFPTVKCEY